MDLQDALQGFLRQLAADGRSPHTIGQYRRHVATLIGWLPTRNMPTQIDVITPAVVAEFFASDAARLSSRGGIKKATSANAQRTSLRCFLRWAHEAGLVTNNPGRLLRRARCAPPPPRALHTDEQTRLLDVLAAATGAEAERDRILVTILLGCGLRLGSAIALDVADVDLDHGELALRVGKNNRPATTILPATLVEKLRVFLAGRTTGPVFRADDRRISMRHAQRRLAGWFAAAKIKGRSAHSLRHSFATALLAKTSDLRLVQAAMNHASIISTTVYVAADRAKLRAAVGSWPA